MARPRTDVAATRERLLEAAEDALKQFGGSRITVSDLAARCGMSQSNAYRFFPSKHALLEAVAARWFGEIEEALARIAESDMPADEAFRAFMLTHLRLKRARYDADPDLFDAYLALGAQHMDVVQTHLACMRSHLTAVVRRLVGADMTDDGTLQRTVLMVEDLTVPLRDPRLIAGNRAAATDERAEAIIAFILRGLRRRAG